MYCSICNIYKEKDNILPCLVNINKDIQLNSLSEKIICYKLTIFCACNKCSYDVNEKIKNNPFFSKCKTILVTDINMPKFLFFSLQLNDETQSDIMQY